MIGPPFQWFRQREWGWMIPSLSPENIKNIKFWENREGCVHTLFNCMRDRNQMKYPQVRDYDQEQLLKRRANRLYSNGHEGRNKMSRSFSPSTRVRYTFPVPFNLIPLLLFSFCHSSVLWLLFSCIRFNGKSFLTNFLILLLIVFIEKWYTWHEEMEEKKRLLLSPLYCHVCSVSCRLLTVSSFFLLLFISIIQCPGTSVAGGGGGPAWHSLGITMEVDSLGERTQETCSIPHPKVLKSGRILECKDNWGWNCHQKSPEVSLFGRWNETALFHPTWSCGAVSSSNFSCSINSLLFWLKLIISLLGCRSRRTYSKQRSSCPILLGS